MTIIKKTKSLILLRCACLSLILQACGPEHKESVDNTRVKSMNAPHVYSEASLVKLKPAVPTERFGIYASVPLTSDLSHLNTDQKRMLSLLIDASVIMDDLFWQQAYGDKQALIAEIEDPKARTFAQINYGPWDRLNDNLPFLTSIDEKALGANFYPVDMSKDEFEAWSEIEKTNAYSIVRRDEQRQLTLIPYHEAYEKELHTAANLLHKASALAENADFAKYLRLRAKALVSGQYRESDMAWMDMKDNAIDVVIGPIENYEDHLYAYRTSFSSYVLIKDLEWSKKLAHFTQFLPELQRGLPVSAKYKSEMPGLDSDLNAYDVIYYAGDSNAGSKTIAINLPNDEEVQLAKGTRRLQLKNAMKAKFDKIMLAIADTLIVEEQRRHVTFDAFFKNTMFHEVAHGLGIKKTVNTGVYVREALKETYSALEEGKADILGLYMVTQLHKKGELGDGELMDNYTTFLAGIFRSIRFGASSAHGKANMVRFNYFQERGAFIRDENSGLYRVNRVKMQSAMTELSHLILTLQGDGDYDGVVSLLKDQGFVSEQLQSDLNILSDAGIPVDVVFEQGKTVLGLK